MGLNQYAEVYRLPVCKLTAHYKNAGIDCGTLQSPKDGNVQLDSHCQHSGCMGFSAKMTVAIQDSGGLLASPYRNPELQLYV